MIGILVGIVFQKVSVRVWPVVMKTLHRLLCEYIFPWIEKKLPEIKLVISEYEDKAIKFFNVNSQKLKKNIEEVLIYITENTIESISFLMENPSLNFWIVLYRFLMFIERILQYIIYDYIGPKLIVAGRPFLRYFNKLIEFLIEELEFIVVQTLSCPINTMLFLIILCYGYFVYWFFTS